MKTRYRAVLVGCGARGRCHALGLLANRTASSWPRCAIWSRSGSRDVRAVVCHQLKHTGHRRRVKEIVEEGGRVRGVRGRPSCPDHAAGIVELDSGARAVLEIGSLAPRHLDDGDFWQDLAVTVWGTHGFARVVLGAGWQAVIRGSGGQVQTGPTDSFPGEPEHLRLRDALSQEPARA